MTDQQTSSSSRTSSQFRIIVAILAAVFVVGAGYWSYMTYCPEASKQPTTATVRRPVPKTAPQNAAPTPAPIAPSAPTGN